MGYTILRTRRDHPYSPGGQIKTCVPTKKKSERQPSYHELMRRVRPKKEAVPGRKPLLKVPAVVTVRNASGLSQAQFAVLLGVSVRTLQKWEQGARDPSGAAKSLIRIAQRYPEVLLDAIQ